MSAAIDTGSPAEVVISAERADFGRRTGATGSIREFTPHEIEIRFGDID
jgi:hypothetical protein